MRVRVRARGLEVPHNMQVRPVFTQVDTGFLYGNSVVCGQTCRSSARSVVASARGFSPDGSFSLSAPCEPEKRIMSELIYSDMMRKTGKTTQTWCTFPANRSDMARKSGSMKDRTRTRFKVCLKRAKNLYLRHRFFNKIRQIHRFFAAFRQMLQILCRNQARPERTARLARNPSRRNIHAQKYPPASR